MGRKGKIAHYRETLDTTLASDNLTDEKKLETSVRDQILRSSVEENKDYIDNVVKKRTAEVSSFLDMLRSVSNEHVASDNIHQATWKLKQDTEEFRVMYREGLVGSPFHSLLVEGYIDAPLDVCLCVSWETSLYPRWFPDMLIPTFKVVAAKSLQKVMIGEEISLVRVKLSWPMSSREAILHYFEFEYLEDGLVIVLLNTISDVNEVKLETHGFSNESIPEVENTVRIGLVGGFALQRVTESRSYFRTIANMDMKLDFVPPTLINFISRQVIGSGFRFYQKTVASVSKGDEAFATVLSGPLYNRIREALSSSSTETTNNIDISHGKENADLQGFPQDVNGEPSNNDDIPKNHLGDMFKVRDETDVVLSNGDINGFAVAQYKPATTTTTEIEEENIGEGEIVLEKPVCCSSTDELQLVDVDKKVANISPQVEKALGTLDKMIHVVREGRLTASTAQRVPQMSSTSRINGQIVSSTPHVSTNGSRSRDQDLETLTSPVQNPPTGSWSRNAVSVGNSPVVVVGSSSVNNVEVDNNIDENKKKIGQQSSKWKLCCLHIVSGRLVS